MASTPRRGFLKTGLLGGAILAGSSVALSLWPPRRRGDAPPLRVLREPAFWTLVALAERVAPAGADGARVARRIDLALTRVEVDAQRQVNALLAILENGVAGVLFNLQPRPFSQRAPEERDATLGEWARSRLALRRGGYQALRKLCLAAHFGDEVNWGALGYPGPPATGGLFYDDPKAGAR